MSDSKISSTTSKLASKLPELKIEWRSLPLSNHLRRAAYLEQHSILLIEYKDGSIYGFREATPALFEGLTKALSPGSYAHKYVYYRRGSAGEVIFGTQLQDACVAIPEKPIRLMLEDSLDWIYSQRTHSK